MRKLTLAIAGFAAIVVAGLLGSSISANANGCAVVDPCYRPPVRCIERCAPRRHSMHRPRVRKVAKKCDPCAVKRPVPVQSEGPLVNTTTVVNRVVIQKEVVYLPTKITAPSAPIVRSPCGGCQQPAMRSPCGGCQSGALTAASFNPKWVEGETGVKGCLATHAPNTPYQCEKTAANPRGLCVCN